MEELLSRDKLKFCLVQNIKIHCYRYVDAFLYNTISYKISLTKLIMKVILYIVIYHSFLKEPLSMAIARTLFPSRKLAMPHTCSKGTRFWHLHWWNCLRGSNTRVGNLLRIKLNFGNIYQIHQYWRLLTFWSCVSRLNLSQLFCGLLLKWLQIKSFQSIYNHIPYSIIILIL